MIKVAFRLEIDDDGWPPFAVETLWAEKVGPDLHRLENIPFFARGVSYGDVVKAEEDEDGLSFREVVEASKSSTIRVIFFDRSKLPELRAALKAIGCDSELNKDSMIAIDVPGDVDYVEVRERLDRGVERGFWDYQESALRHVRNGFLPARPPSCLLALRQPSAVLPGEPQEGGAWFTGNQESSPGFLGSRFTLGPQR